MSDFGWYAVMIVGVVFGLALMSFSGSSLDSTAERIEACMTAPNMQYVDGDCIPQDSE